MKVYIYFIVNNFTGERYIEQTTNFDRRKKEHLSQLRNNFHINSKNKIKEQYRDLFIHYGIADLK